MVLNGGKLSFLVQIPYYWRILQSNIYVNFYRKELCNNEFNNIAIWRIRFQGYRLHWLTQTFARPVANVCNRGCKRLREKVSFYHQASALQIDASGGTGYSAAREVIDGFSRRCLLMVLWCMDGIGERVGIGILQAINCAEVSVGQGIGIDVQRLIPRLSAVCDTLVQAIAE